MSETEHIRGIRNGQRAATSVTRSESEIVVKRCGSAVVVQIEDASGPKATLLSHDQARALSRLIDWTAKEAAGSEDDEDEDES